MRWIYLSPHLDDAVLSAGGLIYEQSQAGIPVEIWTFMCGYPPEGESSRFAQELHKRWGFSSAQETVHARREEDQRAAGIVGAKTLHFDFLDCIYRRDANGEWLYSDVFTPPHEADAGIPAQIAAEISARLNSPFQRSERDVVLVCQLSLGSHVDHVLVRQAAELLGRPLRYDIDIPYLFYHPHDFEPKSAGMKGSVHAVTAAGLERWIEAVLAYESQFPVLGEKFDTPQKAEECIRKYWSEQNGIEILQFS